MTRINTNIPSLVAQHRLQASNRELNLALTRLSTGLRINSGADDPAGLIASESLRSDITALNKAISNTQRAGQIISTADSALTQVSNLLNDIRGLVVEAANRGALSDEEIDANQLQIDSSLEAINRIAQTTTFQGRKLLDGSLDYVSTIGTIGSVQDATISRAIVGSSPLNVEVVVDSAATQAELSASATAFSPAAAANVAFGSASSTISVTATTAGADFNDVRIRFVDDASVGNVAASAQYDATQKVITVTHNTQATSSVNRSYNSVSNAINGLAEFSASMGPLGRYAAFSAPTDEVSTGKTGGEVLLDDLVFQLKGSRGAETFHFDAETSMNQIAAALSLVADSTGVTATSADGLVFRSRDLGSDAYVTVDVISEGSNGAFAASLDATQANGKDIVASVNGVQALGKGSTLSINTSSLALSLTVDNSARNFSFQISSGGAAFQLGPDVSNTQQAHLGIASVSTGRLGGTAGRLFELGTGQAKSLTNDVVGAGDVIDQVIAKVTSLRGRLGAFQATTLESNLVNLTETVTHLQEAESLIRDADFAHESSALTRAQILVQTGTSVLALANQNPQNVLALLLR